MVEGTSKVEVDRHVPPKRSKHRILELHLVFVPDYLVQSPAIRNGGAHTEKECETLIKVTLMAWCCVGVVFFWKSQSLPQI